MSPPQGVKNVADAAKELGGIDRVVVVSSALVTPKNRFHPVRILLNNIRWEASAACINQSCSCCLGDFSVPRHALNSICTQVLAARALFPYY